MFDKKCITDLEEAKKRHLGGLLLVVIDSKTNMHSVRYIIFLHTYVFMSVPL